MLGGGGGGGEEGGGREGRRMLRGEADEVSQGERMVSLELQTEVRVYALKFDRK